MLKFVSFGSGSSGNSYLIENDKDAIIVDAGIGIRKMKKEMFNHGIITQKIRAIIITHDHFDHCSAAYRLAKFLNVKICASQAVLEKSMRFKIDPDMGMPVENKQAFRINSFVITPFRIPHDSVDNFGYAIETNGQLFTVMTDIGEPNEDVKYYIEHSNHIVIEADYDEYMLDANTRYDKTLKERIKGGFGHISNNQTAELLTNHYHDRLKNIWLCHLSAENNTPELALKTISEALRNQGIELGQNLHLHALLRDEVCGPFYIPDNSTETYYEQLKLNI